MLTDNYKFYLSFENSECSDYVTEKFYNALSQLVVPIVFGGADYSKFAPPDSYINVNDFANIQELGEYLQFLDRHPEEYIKYFRWKQRYEVQLNYQTIAAPFCDICNNLHGYTGQSHSVVYEDINKWWHGNACSYQPNDIFL